METKKLSIALAVLALGAGLCITNVGCKKNEPAVPPSTSDTGMSGTTTGSGTSTSGTGTSPTTDGTTSSTGMRPTPTPTPIPTPPAR